MYERRLATDPAEYASRLLRATNTERLLVDDGFPPPGERSNWDELGELAGCEARPVMRIERSSRRRARRTLGGEASQTRASEASSR